MITLSLDGEEVAGGRLQAWHLAKRGQVMEALDDAALALEKDWKENAPVDTGRYRSNIRVMRPDPAPMTREVGSFVGYDEHLEYGTKYMAARPSAGPAAERASRQFRRDVVTILRQK